MTLALTDPDAPKARGECLMAISRPHLVSYNPAISTLLASQNPTEQF